MNRSIAMKNAVLSLLALFLACIPAISFGSNGNGWIFQNPYPTSNTLLAAKFITPTKGWMAGENGTILYTEDGGNAWEYQESKTEHELKSIAFVNDKVGWAVGKYGVIIHTEDGGRSWTAQQGSKTTLNSVCFISEKEGWAVGNQGTVLYTADGGNTWHHRDIGTSRAISSVYFLNSERGWILAGDEIYSTADNGGNWEKKKLEVKIPKSGTVGKDTVLSMIGEEVSADWSNGEIYFTDEKRGWAVIGLWFIFHTEDGGKTWANQLNTGYMSYGLGRVKFTDAKSGCAVGSSILCTEDGGKTWNEKLKIAPGQRERINDFLIYLKNISFVSPSIGWAVGNEGQMFKTEDSGKTWKMESRRHKCGGETFFINNKAGWLYKRESTFICRTNDGGYTLTKQNLGMEVSSVFFFDDKIGWATGRLKEIQDAHKQKGKVWAIIKHTSDGGKTWIAQFKEVISDFIHDRALSGVFFLNSEKGWVVGEQGMILQTDNGGKHWKQQQRRAEKLHLRKIYFLDSNRGWITGNRRGDNWLGVILYTWNSGQHWRTQYQKKGTSFDGVSFVNGKSGWITGIPEYIESCQLYHTRDGGDTWEEHIFKLTGLCFDVYPEGQQIVTFTDKGWIIFSNDGGVTWLKRRMLLTKYPMPVSEIYEKVQGGRR